MARRNDIPPENLFTLPPELPAEEVFTTLFATQQVRIERIISHGQTTPPGEWYDQPQDEWVMVLQGEGHLSYDNGHRGCSKGGRLCAANRPYPPPGRLYQPRPGLHLVGDSLFLKLLQGRFNGGDIDGQSGSQTQHFAGFVAQIWG
jgi:hypothetical protein